MKKTYRTYLTIMILLSLSMVRATAQSMDPTLAAMVLLYTEKAENTLEAQKKAMLLETTGHIWIEEEVDDTYKLHKEFNEYLDYLYKSVEILCTNYGKIGGLWFDGNWSKEADWEEDALYGMIRQYQPEAMIINNTGLSELGKVGHPEIDSVTFERGNPAFVDNSDKYRAGEMCQVLNDHWGYAAGDCNYKSVKELIEGLVVLKIDHLTVRPRHLDARNRFVGIAVGIFLIDNFPLDNILWY